MRGDRRIDMQNYYSHASTDSRHDAMQVMEEKFGRRDVRPVQPTEKQLSMTEVFELVKSGNITEVEFAEKIAAITGSATK